MVLVIISGRSGSGKSFALRALEDMGFYCVDNLPVVLLPQLAEILVERKKPAAVSIDVRNMPESPEVFKSVMEQLPACFSPQLLFLDADNKTLIRRYSDTRRQHPLLDRNSSLEIEHTRSLADEDLSLENAIAQESTLLESLRSRADLVIDTSEMSVHELANILRARLIGKRERELTIVFESFGFKHGLPIDADYVFDVRFLPNPHWDPKLRPMTGLDKPVVAFLARHVEIHNFIYQTRSYLETCLPMLEANNRSYLTIAIGCTGGKHRSVYITEQLADYFRSRGKHVQSRHRTLEKRK
ncbi:RNase adapter RapZ [Candidatus Fukatsuia symbiotica]|uniref:RNase adapter protein RapZ n=1 Tax=Candidatus Fukatsuia symbiotica TaxID=1878942 RepID=A0A2U8IA51_9GAMM|nr:RNase adapter RapZ [Candidatus Fukatsuia symbiotica]AWK14935.1 RNase adaptor protein RapZ [Candidatus Fukatsuia symbiotica]MEA9445292.1 RNase adapter RapZ [Candidatus Fukatsuia symbiotica]